MSILLRFCATLPRLTPSRIHHNAGLLLSNSRQALSSLPKHKSCLIGIVVGCGVGTTGFIMKDHLITLKERFSPVLVAQCKTLKRADYFDRKDDSELNFDWKQFFLFLWPDILLLVTSIVSALAAAMVNVYIPILLGDLINILADKIKEPGYDYFSVVRLPALKLLGSYALQGIFTAVYITLLSSIGENMASRMRKALFSALVDLDIEFFDTHRTGELLNRLTGDIQDFKSSFKMVISQGLRSSAQIVGSLCSLIAISPALTGIMCATITCLVGAGSLFGAGLRNLSKKAQKQTAKSASVADEAISNIRTVKAFAMEDSESVLYVKEVNKACESNAILGLGIGVFQGLSNFALNSLILGVLFTGGMFMSQKDLSAGDLMAFLVSTQAIQRSLSQLSMLFGQVVRGGVAGARVFEYMRLHPSITGGDYMISDSSMAHAGISFQDVSFTYLTRKDRVLQHFNLDVPKGKVVALVGKSGAGKSTVAALLERFYDPTSGEILLDDRNLKTYNVKWLRKHFMGLISQEPQLFHTSIRENIRYGRPEASDAEVEDAAKLANADQFIRHFPQGYDTPVGEKGTALSGGQKQRIAIARALIKNPALLILDEATSALDSESEYLVQQALDRVMKGRTVLVIAHRLSTVKSADHIVVMANGKILEQGNHHVLMKKGGYYADLVKRQQSGLEDD